MVVEGGEGRKLDLLSQQVTEPTLRLLPHAQVAMIEGVNPLLPLQNPDAAGRIVAGFALQRPILTAATGHAST